MSNIEQKQRKSTINLVAALAIAILLSSVTAGLYAAPKKPKLSADHAEFYKYARYFFTKMERKLFLNLPDNESRSEFIKNFWEIRNPNPMSDENEFRVEIERRFEYVSRYLKEGPVPGWKTDRGRIYLLLGPPSNRFEQTIGSQFGREIYWYYWESSIYARFVDPNGNGRYQMDLRAVSLSLLDELERRKYYIQNKDKKEAFETAILKFSAKYNKEFKAVEILLSPKNLNFIEHKDGVSMVAEVKVNMIVYPNKKQFFKHNVIKTLRVPKEKLLENKAKLTLNIPLELPAGKVGLDIILTDHMGDAVQRKYIKIKN